jgi:preprotein translocase subunit YajC
VESLIFLPLIFGLMWLLLIRPRQRWERQHQELVRSLEVGDEVVTTAGVYGTITEVEPDIVHVEIADGVVVRVARLAIGRRADDPALRGAPDEHRPLPSADSE